MEENLTSRQRQAIETKKRLYHEAVNLFKTHPYEEVKIADICEKANVSTGVFYHYFESKSHIFNEGYVNFSKQLEEYFKTIEDKNPMESVILIFEKYFSIVEEMGHIYRRVFLRNELEVKSEYKELDKNQLYIYTLDLIGQAIDKGILSGDQVEISKNLLRFSKGLVYNWSLYRASFNLSSEGIKTIKTILDYYKK